MKKRVLVSGVSSVIGQSLVQRLQAAGYSVVQLSRKTSDDTDHCQWDFSTQGLADTSLPKNILTHGAIDALVHCAPIWLLPDHLLALGRLGVHRVIAFSSTSIDGKSRSNNPHDQEIVQLLQKAESDAWRQVKNARINLSIFRPTMIYGYGQGANLAFIANVIQRFGFFPIVTGAIGLRKPVHADDLANAVCLAIFNQDSYGKTYNLSGSEELSYEQMVQRLFQVLGKKPKLVKLPLPIYRGVIALIVRVTKMSVNPSMADRMREDLNFDSTAAENDFAYDPGEFLPNGAQDIMRDK
ncbi:MAG: NAD-dependent epimerase/dehydratase family protein [Arenicella sp.]